MKDARANLSAIKEAFSSGERVLFLDFDGTLAPIVPDPMDAHMSESMRAVLAQCSARFTVVVISGRSLADVEKRIQVPAVICAGNHGLEWGTKTARHSVPVPEDIRAVFPSIREAFDMMASRYDGASVEDKVLSITLHYRRVPERERAALAREARAALAPYVGKVIVRDSALTVECVPKIAWNKGAFALHVLATTTGGRGASIYIGDELTDEDAFRVLPGIGVKVGKSATSAAHYYLASQADVEPFIVSLLA